MLSIGWDWGVPGIDYPASAEDYRMTDDEILDECRQRFARDLAMTREEYERAYRRHSGCVNAAGELIKAIAEEKCQPGYYYHVGSDQFLPVGADPDTWNKYANAAYGFSDTGDETSPSESNPVPIEEIYEKIPKEETIEERNERMMKLLREFAQS
jgi:hypothetical protein